MNKFELEPFNRNVGDRELLNDLKRCCDRPEGGSKLTCRAYKEIGKYSVATVCARFGSWNEALKKAGLQIVEEKNIADQSLFDNLKEVWIRKGKQPTYRDMNIPPSVYSGATYGDRFGGWRKCLEKFVAAVNEEQESIHNYEAEVSTGKVKKRTKRDPSLGLRFLVLERDHFRCVKCGRSPASEFGLVLEVDHVTPWSNGGETIESNLQTLCFDCNRGKGAN